MLAFPSMTWEKYHVGVKIRSIYWQVNIIGQYQLFTDKLVVSFIIADNCRKLKTRETANRVRSVDIA